ncbi:MAG: hypothetical protein ACTSRO_10725, partial [Candidatus Heimdallarchaeaceae archaeon]
TLMRENETQGIINYMDDLGDVPIMLGGDFNSNSPFDVGDVAGVAHNLGTGPIRMLLIPDDPVYGKYSSHVHNFTDNGLMDLLILNTGDGLIFFLSINIGQTK